MPAGTEPSTSIDSFTIACYVDYALLGWVLSGLGAVLPQLRDDLGGLAGIYPTLPGAALVIIGLLAFRRGHAPGRSHQAAIARGSIALVVALAALSLTAVRPISALGAVFVGLMAAALIRLMPAAITSRHPADAPRMMTRANAWSSLASIVAPLAIGGAIELGIGWRTGLLVLPAIGAVVAVALVGGLPAIVDRRLTTASDEVIGQRNPAESVDLAVGFDVAGLAAAGDEVPAPTAASPATARPLPWIDAWALLALSITVEFAFVFFASTYLREEVGLASGPAAAGAAAFAVGMAISRFLAGAVPALTAAHINVHLGTIAVGFLLMWAVPNPVTAIAGITIAGIGTALLYPIGIGRLMRRFPDSIEQGAARGALASGTALLGSPALLGAIRALSSVRIAYLSVPLLLGVIALIFRGADDRLAAAERALAG